MITILIIAVATALAVVSYAAAQRLGRRGLPPAAGRAIAWASVALLLLNPACPRPGGSRRPLVLLDGSLSMTAATGRWSEARALAASLGEVQLFGDPTRALDTVPDAGSSRLAPALIAAAAADRPVVVITDGEISDGPELPPDLLRLAEVRILPRSDTVALAIRRVDGPPRIASGDTLEVDLEIASAGIPPGTTVQVAAALPERAIATGRATIVAGGARTRLRLPPGTLPAGEHLLTLRLLDSLDREPRDDARYLHVVVAPSPGLVLVASPPDWDSRFLARALADVTDLPLAAFVELEPGRWRRMSDLVPVERVEVTRAIERADLLIRVGPGAPGAGATAAVWEWGTQASRAEAGDWYFDAAGPSPLAAALGAAPLESLPPATAVAGVTVADSVWTALSARLGRRGEPRAVFVGELRAGRRTVRTLGEGLWRWAFRGGRGEQAYRALVAATVDWLLAAPLPEQGTVRPLTRVTPAGRRLNFVWTGPGQPEPTPIQFVPREPGATLRDTLRFDAAGTAGVRLPPGVYTYVVEGRSRGLLAVETYSEEWFPRPRSLDASAGAWTAPTQARHPRDIPWLYLLAVLGFSGEWAIRRRRGLR